MIPTDHFGKLDDHDQGNGDWGYTSPFRSASSSSSAEITWNSAMIRGNLFNSRVKSC